MLCIINIICAVICGAIASAKGRNVVGWSLLGLLGLIPIIIVACLPNLNEQAARDTYVDNENRRLREQLRQERIKSESFRQHAAARLDAHDQKLGMDTRQTGPALGAGVQAAGQLSDGGAFDPTQAAAAPEPNMPRWYYGREGRTLGPVKASEIGELIRLEIINRQTLLWCEDMTDWQPAGEIATFAENFV